MDPVLEANLIDGEEHGLHDNRDLHDSEEHGLHDNLHLHDGIETLHIDATTAVTVEDTNPWRSSASSDSDPDPHDLHTPDPLLLDTQTTQGLASEVQRERRPPTNAEVLLEFDPLASQEEKAAREAWASATPHPPPPPVPPAKDISPEAALPSLPSTSSRSSSPIPAFPSLAALARTFSIPLGPRRDRPRSLDMATSVPSPATLSSFAAQQSAPPVPSPMRKAVENEAKANGSASVAGSGRSTPSLVSKGKDKDEVPFDFQNFLDQMKLKGAEPVAKYLRSFLSNFAKRTFTVNDQIKLINDFLNFISARMHESEVWRNASDAEFDNAMEGMEKLVMNRLYDFTFTPQVAHMVPPRPVTADDLERDRVLAQRIALFGWIEPRHLDLPEGEGSEGFLMFAQQELLKVNHYKAPRDKLICILNCCKVIFGLIRHLHKEEGADTFVPILIYVVLKANPPHLLSNVEFINRFRNPAKLQSEAGYYLSSLMGAVSFIETMDHTSLSNITQEEFEQNVETAIQLLPNSPVPTPGTVTPPVPTTPSGAALTTASHAGEESAQPLSLPTPAQTLGDDARRFLQKTGDTISKPLGAISRIFSEVLDGAEESFTLPSPFAQQAEGVPQTPLGGETQQRSTPLQTPYKPRVRRVPSPLSSARSSVSLQSGSPTREETPTRQVPYTNRPLSLGPSQSTALLQPSSPRRDLRGLSPHVSRTPTPSLDLTGIQEEIDRATEKAAVAARETLRQIFPQTDPEVVEWVLEANEGDLGKSIEALLEVSSGT
ncbi:hypothetical protein SCP_1601980 [Sparassis crispa]|uniref:Vacuolar protein sorting-associated protein n=1 Tax=Sparassis crispa TaxID=139825 RepID=A0A401H514_9APHY|nr:hypothetical protein SCP_1601980 [Sparassis crispa]GBE89536.1 hypothetical protein SCP_1601980 [Sparassis crispa]